MTKNVFIFIILVLSGSTIGHAADQSTSQRGVNYWNRPMRVFGMAGAGYASVSGSEFTSNPDGAQLSLGGLVSYMTPRWAFDAGVGAVRTELNGSTTDGNKIHFKNTSANLELSPRYRVGERWQVGPVANILYSADAASYASANDAYRYAVMVGPKLAYEWPWGNLAARAFLQATTDLNISERQITTAMVGLQIGLPWGGSSDSVRISQAAPTRNVVRVSLPASAIRYQSGSTQLNARGNAIVAEMAAYLKSHAHDWQTIEVAGHADRRGSYAINKKISENRAKGVKAALAAQGLPQNKIQAIGYSFTEPVMSENSAQAHAANRRVEVVIQVSGQAAGDVEKMQNDLEQMTIKN